MYIKTMATLAGLNIGLSILAQADFIPEGAMGVILQLPIVAIYAYSMAYVAKWLSGQMKDTNDRHHEQLKSCQDMHQVEMQRSSQLHQEQIVALFTEFSRLASVVSDMSGQMAINTATVNESLRTGELVEEIKKSLLARGGKHERDD